MGVLLGAQFVYLPAPQLDSEVLSQVTRLSISINLLIFGHLASDTALPMLAAQEYRNDSRYRSISNPSSLEDDSK